MVPQQVQPDFLSQFICKRSSCRRTCCRDWDIRLTKQEFEARSSSQLDPESRALAEHSLHPNPDAEGDDDYALCAMRTNGFCSLLTDDRLCSWKKLRGEALCAACENFPNTYLSFEQTEYIFPSLSCEAIVELLLQKTDPIRLVSEDLQQMRDRFQASIKANNFSRRPLLALYPRLIQWGLDILQDRRFSLDDRMVLLANAMSMVDRMERNRRVGDVPDAVNKFLEVENLGKVLHRYDQYSIGPKAILTVNGDTFVRFIRASAYQADARRVLEGLGIEVLETEEDGQVRCSLKMADREKYLKRKEDLSGFMREREILLEHVMVCEYLRSMIPVTKPGVWENFSFFNVCYALLKGMLLGSFNSSPRDSEIVDAIMVLYRMLIHNYDAYNDSLEYLKAIELTDLMSMVALAKG